MKKFLKGFVFAWNGLQYSFRTQVNFRFHCAAILVVAVLGYYLKLNYSDWLWIAVSIGITLIAELINTAIEKLVDLVSPEYNPNAGLVKDISAAAVLVAALTSLIIGLVIFIPKLLGYAL